MGDVVNLNRYRKDHGRAENAARAAANRLRFGRTKAEKQADRATAEHQETHLDQHRLTGAPDPDRPAPAADAADTGTTSAEPLPPETRDDGPTR